MPGASRPAALGGGVRRANLRLTPLFLERGFIRRILSGREFQFHAAGVADGAASVGALIEHVSLKLVQAFRANPDVSAHADLLRRLRLAREIYRSPVFSI